MVAPALTSWTKTSSWYEPLSVWEPAVGVTLAWRKAVPESVVEAVGVEALPVRTNLIVGDAPAVPVAKSWTGTAIGVQRARAPSARPPHIARLNPKTERDAKRARVSAIYLSWLRLASWLGTTNGISS